MSPELLKKYHSAACTAEERAAVEAWLYAEEVLPAGNADKVVDAPAVKKEIWQGIAQGMQQTKRRRLVVRYTGIAAAACMLLAVLSGKTFSGLFHKTITIDNRLGAAVSTVHIGNLQFAVQPNSSCTVTLPFWGNTPGQVQLCGAVSVVNAAGVAVRLQVNTDQQRCPGNEGSDVVSLNGGQTYLAMTDQHYHLISATQQELRDGLPRSFSARLTERFKL